jgi:hypothetical protein
MSLPQTIAFRLDLTPDEFLAYYRGRIRDIIVTAHDGRRVQFPANRLQPFLTHAGIHGEFELEFDGEHRCQAVRRLR